MTAKEKENTYAIKEDHDELVELVLPLTMDPGIDAYGQLYTHRFKNYLIKRGEKVMVPRALKRRVEEIEATKLKAYQYAQKTSLAAAEIAFKQNQGII